MAVSNKRIAESETPSFSRQDVRDQVARICASPPFRASKRCIQLLEYISERASSGQMDGLKERTLGVEVFGRDTGYDTSHDPVVRYTAGEVRKRLAQYYQAPGHERELRIELPPGSYVPRFESPPEPLPRQVASVVALGERHTRHWWWIAAILAFVVLAGAWGLNVRPPTSVDRFWAPAFADHGPVLLSIGVAKVFSFPEPLRTRVRKEGETYFRAGKPLPDSVVPEGKVWPLFDRYVPVGDAFCLARLAALFQSNGKAYRFRRGTTTTLSDLRDGTGVLIGAFTNRWTLTMTESLRFHMEHNAEGAYGIVRDRSRPSFEQWRVPDVWPDPKQWTDYGLVTRMRHPSTNRYIIIAAGINRYATSAAGELLTSPDLLDEVLSRAPAGWENKNLQIVYSTPVVEESAGAPSVLAVHVW